MTRKPKEADDGTDKNEADRAPGTDVAERSYYYDDAHGYEEFDPDSGDDKDDADELEQGIRSTEN